MHRSDATFTSSDLRRAEVIDSSEVIAFAELSVKADSEAVADFVQALIAEGVSEEKIFTDLMAPAARHLGVLWEEDLCTFSDVAIGLMRMQQLTMRLGADFQQIRKTGNVGPRALFAPLPGSQHTLGILMVSDIFRREGWQVWMEFGGSEEAILAAVAKDWFSIAGLSIGSETEIPYLTSLVHKIRKASCNPDIRVLVGGPLLNVDPGITALVGADFGSSDARSAADQVKRMLS